MSLNMDIEEIEQELVSTIRIEFEKEDKSKMNVIEILPTTLKQEPPDDEMHETVVKVEKVKPVVKAVVSLNSKVKDETSSGLQVKEEISLDDAGEGFSGVKTEELMIKSESEYGSDDSREQELQDPKQRKEDHACDRCDFRTTSIHDLIIHMNMQHVTNFENDLRLFCCAFCSYKTGIRKCFQDHILTQHANLFKCDYCTYITTFKNQLQYHMLQECEEIAEKLTCNYCDYKTCHETKMGDHMIKKHVSSKHYCSSPLKYLCKICTYSSADRNAMMVHMSVKHNNYSMRKYICHLCNYKSYHKRYISRHVLSKHGTNSIAKYNCKFCVYKTNNKRALAVHVSANHKDSIKKYVCDLCDYKSDCKGKLTKHVLSKHNLLCP